MAEELENYYAVHIFTKNPELLSRIIHCAETSVYGYDIETKA